VNKIAYMSLFCKRQLAIEVVTVRTGMDGIMPSACHSNGMIPVFIRYRHTHAITPLGYACHDHIDRQVN
jgi:hypothetical protein